MAARDHDRISTTLLALATVAVSGAFVAGLVFEPRAAGANATKPAEGAGGFDGFDPDTFSSSEPAKGMGGGGGGMGMGGGGGGGAAGGGSSGGGSSGGGSSGGGGSPQAGGGQPTSGGNFNGGGGMSGATSSGGSSGGATSGAMSSGGGTPAAGGATGGAKAKPTTGAGGANAGKSSATSSKASKARIAWLSAQQKARLNDALEGIYQAELDSLTDGAFLAVRHAACVAGPGSTTPVPVAPPAGGPVDPKAGTPPAAPAAPAADEKPPTLSDGATLPKGCDDLQALAEKCDKEARYDDALLAATQLVRVRGTAKDFAFLGFLEEMYGTYEAADEAYGKALAIEPAHVGAKAGKAFIAVAQGKAAAWVEGLAKDANAPKGEFLFMLATSFVSNAAKTAEPARAALEQAVAAAGQDVPKLRAAIELGIEMKVRGPLVAALDTCLRAAPNDAKFHALRLALAVEEGPPAAALAALHDAQKLAPGDVEPYIFEAYLELKDEKNDRALSCLKTALKLAPTNGRCALLEAHTLDRKGSKEALMAYAHAAELDPKSAEPWIASALIVHNKSDYDDAEGKLLAATKAEPRNPEPLYYLAIIQGDRQGFLGKAEDTLKRYRKLGGENDEALAWLQSLEDAQNN